MCVCVCGYIYRHTHICPHMGLQVHVVLLFLIVLRNLYTSFHTCTILQFHQLCTSIPIFPPSCYHLLLLLLLLLLIVVLLIVMRWYLILILICTSLMIKDTEFLFICLRVISISSLGKVPVQDLCPFLNWVIYFCCYWVASISVLSSVLSALQYYILLTKTG